MTDRNVNSGRVIRDEGVGSFATLTGDVAEDLQRPVKPFYAGILSSPSPKPCPPRPNPNPKPKEVKNPSPIGTGGDTIITEPTTHPTHL